MFCSQIGLEISKAELSDAGSYECHLSNDVGKVTGACGVTVHKIFAPPFFSKQLTDVKQARVKRQLRNIKKELCCLSLADPQGNLFDMTCTSEVKLYELYHIILSDRPHQKKWYQPPL